MTRQAQTPSPGEQSPQTKAALAILQAAVDRDKFRKRMRYSHGYMEKPTTHDELQEALDRATKNDLPKGP